MKLENLSRQAHLSKLIIVGTAGNERHILLGLQLCVSLSFEFKTLPWTKEKFLRVKVILHEDML